MGTVFLAGSVRVLGGFMGHDWIIDVLQDLKSYALANGMPQLAETAAEALKVAEAEISAKIDTHLPPKDLPRQ